MSVSFTRLSRRVGGLLALILLAHAPAEAATPSVAEPAGINLGLTSFFDGFPAAAPGQLSYLGYYRYTHANAIKDSAGNKIDAFGKSNVDTWLTSHQFLYTFAHSPFENASLGLDLIIPIVGFHTDFGDAPAKLQANDAGFGDIFIGTYLQINPVMDAQGTPLFAQRFEIGFNVPTGKYDAKQDINPGANQWSFTPTWAATWLFAPRASLNWRLQYLVNFNNTNPASSAPLDWKGESVQRTRAGQLAWLNFAAEYEVAPKWHLGINGYYLKQISDDKVNGDDLPNSREQVLGIGPGLMWNHSANNTLTLNFYTETAVENRLRNSAIANLFYIHGF